MFSFLKKNAESATAAKEIGYEERERKTPFAGYVLLIAMTIVSVWLGFIALDDLQSVPAKPQALSACAAPYTTYGWQDAWRYGGPYYDYAREPVYSPESAYPYPIKAGGSMAASQTCVFSEIEKKRGVSAAFEKSKNIRDETAQLQSVISQKQTFLYQAQTTAAELRRQYELGLQEKGVQMPGRIYNPEQLQAQLGPIESRQIALNAEISDASVKMAALSAKLKPYNEELAGLYKAVVADWRTEWRWYELWVFLLQSLFVFPFFFIVLKTYFRLSAKNSPYTIIATFALITASVFALYIAVVYFWSLFLAVILEALWSIIKQIQILKSIITYVGMLLTIFLFGGAVYLLQKKIFNPARVALRHLRDKQCPFCRFSLDLSRNFCPHCGEQILEKCVKCQNARFVRMAVCPYCGDRK